MGNYAQYAPGPAAGAQVRKNGEQWTLILVRELRHRPEKVWEALTNPVHLREWAPFEVDGNLGAVGNRLKLTWAGTGAVTEAIVTEAHAPHVLEFQNIRWVLDPTEVGTRLTLWHTIDRRYVTWGAAGWHICFDVLVQLLDGHPLGRIAGADAMKSPAWKRLTAEYANLFGANE